MRHRSQSPYPPAVRTPKSTGVLTGVLHSRRVPLRGALTERAAACGINRMLILAADNRKQPIIIDVESPVASVRECLSIVRTMNGVSCPVATFSRGKVGGPSIMIAAHGLAGFRVATPEVVFLFGSTNGELETPEGSQSWHSLLQILVHDTGKPEATVARWFRDGVNFNAEQALSAGIIDVISPEPLFPPSVNAQLTV